MNSVLTHIKKNVKAKGVSVGLIPLAQIHLCSVYNSPISIDNAVACNASSQSHCKSKADVKMAVISVNDKLRPIIQVKHALIETVFNLAISKLPENNIVKKTYKQNI